MPEQFTRDQAQIEVIVKGVAFRGWLQSEVERSLESLCGTFTVPVTFTPGQPPRIARGDEVSVRIGAATVITGHVLAAEPFYRRGEFGMRVTGRDRTGDLVRSSAIHKGGQWKAATLTRIAKDLAAPFGIEVAVDADVGAPIADFKISHGESVLDTLSRAARLRGVLVTRDDAGRLLLTKAGKQRFEGVVRIGANVISMEAVGTDEQRHSEYVAYAQSNYESLNDFDAARSLKATAKDAEIKRYLPLVINSDGNRTQAELQALVDHTVRVRRGHAIGFKYTVEGWTFKGKPWPLNQRVAVYDEIAGFQGEELLIASVRHTCDLKEGDVTELLLRPVEAYDTVPLKTLPKHRNFGNKGNTTNHPPSAPSRSAPR